MTEKKHPLGFVFKDGRVFGSLKHGLSVSGVIHKDFELREALVDDILDAEIEVDVAKPLNFNAQMMVRQLIKVGTFDGPFTVGMIRRLKPLDWRILRAAQTEIDDRGEAELASEPIS